MLEQRERFAVLDIKSSQSKPPEHIIQLNSVPLSQPQKADTQGFFVEWQLEAASSAR